MYYCFYFTKASLRKNGFPQSRRDQNRAGKKKKKHFPVFKHRNYLLILLKERQESSVFLPNNRILTFCGLGIRKEHQPLEAMSILELYLFQ